MASPRCAAPVYRQPTPDTQGRHAEVVREGSEITIVAISGMVPKAVEAAALLERQGVSVEVVDPLTVAPLDLETIAESVHKTGRLLVVEEDYAPCSVAADIAARVGD